MENLAPVAYKNSTVMSLCPPHVVIDVTNRVFLYCVPIIVVVQSLKSLAFTVGKVYR